MVMKCSNDVKSGLEYINIDGYKIKRVYAALNFFMSMFRRKKIIWRPVYIQYINGSGITMCYLVNITEDHPSYRYVIKPEKMYKNIEFAMLFGFGFGSKGYTTKRMIGLSE